MRSPRLLCLALVTALLATGCGMFSDPSVSSEDEALDALLALRDGMEGRLTAELVHDEGELRDALRDDAEARDLLSRELDGDTDLDALLEDIDAAQATLAEHALVLGAGADGSTRVAATWRGVVWLDLRSGGGLPTGSDPADGVELDLQARVDWTTASELFDQPDLLGDLDAAAAEIAPFLDQLPDTAALDRVILGFLGGDLVGISGPVGPDLLEGLGGLSGMAGDDLVEGTTVPELDLDPRELLATAVTIDGFRMDGDDTVADVTFELRAVGELLLDRVAEAPDAFGTTFADVDQARTDLRELPERLTDVATLRFDGDGTLTQVRTDVVDVLLQTARAAAPDDEDLAVAERLAGRLAATGLFVVLDVTDVGAVTTVLGEPSATVTPEELAAAFGAAFLGGLGGLEGLPGGALPDPDDLADPGAAPDDGEPVAGDDPPTTFGDEALRPDELAVGDCFDDDVLFGFAPADADATVPCDQEHDNEAFALVETAAETYDELTRNEDDAVACIEQFGAYVGVAYADSELVVDVLRPSETEFAAGARTSVCYLYGFERLTGSMAGTGR